MKKFLSIFSVIAMTLLFVSPVSAHVRFVPNEAIVGRQTYDIRVPNEKPIPTVKVLVVVPDGVEVTGILPVPGWTHSEKKVPVEKKDAEEGGHSDEEATERITEITWEGGTINPGEYQLFSIATNYEGAPKELVWKTFQTYSDGSTVAWDNSTEEAEAPTVKITAVSPTETLQKSVETLRQQQKDSEGFEPDANTWLAGTALVIGLAGLIVAIRKK